MSTNSSNPVAMEASILLKVDDANTRREINRSATVVSQALNRVEQQAGKQAGRALSQTISEVSGKLKEGADKIRAALEVPLKFGLAAGGASIAAFLKSNTAEATRFKARLAEVQTSLGAVGQKLATEVKVFGGKTAYEWAGRLADYLKNLDTTKIQKVADIVKGLAVTVAGLKGFSIGADLVKSAAEITRVVNGLRTASTVSTAASVAGGVGSVAATAAGGAGAVGAAGAGVGAVGGYFALTRQARRAAATAARMGNLADEYAVRGMAFDSPELTAQANKMATAYYAKKAVAEDAEKAAYASRTAFLHGARGVGGGAAGGAVSGKLVSGIGSPLVVGAAALGGLALGFEGGNLARRLQGKDRIGYGEAWRAIQQEGLRWNWWDQSPALGNILDTSRFTDAELREYRRVTKEQSQKILSSNFKTLGEQQEAQRRAVLRRAGMTEGGVFGRNLTNITGTSALLRQYGTEDAGRVEDATYGDLKTRIPAMSKLAEEAGKVAEEMRKLRDMERAGTASYDFYDNLYAQALARSDTLRRAITDIERLGAAERRERAALEAERSMLHDEQGNFDPASSPERMRAVADFADAATEIKRRYEEGVASRDYTSVSLGMAASRMPAFTATRLNEASNTAKDLAREQAEYLRELSDLEKERKQTEQTWRSEDMEARRVLDERIRKIEEAIAGVGVGTPAP